MSKKVCNFGYLTERQQKCLVFGESFRRDFFYYCEVKRCLMMVVVRVWGMESRKATMELVLHQEVRKIYFALSIYF
jgi:hypothetical protein